MQSCSGVDTMDFQLVQAEGARVKRVPAANRDAEDLALQCDAGTRKAGWIGKEADAAYALCEQALAIDPNNVRALMALGIKFLMPAAPISSGDSTKALNISTRRFWRARTIRCSPICMPARRGPISG